MGIVQISPGSTNPLLTDRGLANVFRVCGRDDAQGPTAAAYIAQKYKGKRIAVVDDKSTYGKGLADQFRAATGWMHNRARMVVGSFLTKDLHLDWRSGEAWFERMLLDGEPAQNNGNWQWIASTGVDPAPYFRRMFNPVLQQQKFDPDGAYVRRWVPELRDVPGERLAEPWKMTDEEQGAAGCRIGEDYPEPVVDHAQERQVAMARYRAAAAPEGDR